MPNKYAHFSRQAQQASHRLRSCENKKPFNTKEEAAKTGNKAYKCRYCQKWHTSGSQARFINTMVKRHDSRISKNPPPTSGG